MNEAVDLTASEAVRLLKHGEMSSAELMDAVIDRIEEVDGAVNAVVVRFFEEARREAGRFRLDEARIGDPSYLAGLPLLAKEFNEIAGTPVCYGSKLYLDRISETTDVPVRRLQRNGGVFFGKSNVPEFAGASTFNKVYGATLNPWNQSMTAGGSSGGSAAALASKTAWLAMGTDLGGSLRIPASFCGVVGMRPSPGRVARGKVWPKFDPLLVEGPMARNVDDLALMMDAQAGRSVDDPMSWERPTISFAERSRSFGEDWRFTFSDDLGLYPIDPRVQAVFRSAIGRLDGAGLKVSESSIDLKLGESVFDVVRALLLAVVHGETVRAHREDVLPAIVDNVERGFELTSDEIVVAERERNRLFDIVEREFETTDFVLTPTVAVPPFPIEQHFPLEVGGRACHSYIDWMFLTTVVTPTSCPAISIPCGFDEAGLPVGLQIIGRPGADAEVIAAAKRIEDVLGVSPLPMIAREPGR